MTRHEGYEKRKLRLKVANKHLEDEIDAETTEKLLSVVEEDPEFVDKALHDPGFKLSENDYEVVEDKVKPDPLNLSWEEAQVLDEYLSSETGSLDSVEKIEILQDVHDKVRDARQ